jgi:hypothetical protein
VSYSSVPLFVLDSVIVGTKLCHFVVFWKSLSGSLPLDLIECRGGS